MILLIIDTFMCQMMINFFNSHCPTNLIIYLNQDVYKVLCGFTSLNCLFVLILYILVNIFSVMSGLVFLG